MAESFIYVNIVPCYFLLQKLKSHSILNFILLYQLVFFFSLNLLMRHKFLKFQVPIMKGSNRIRELNIVILIESFIYVNIVPRYFLLQKLKFYSILKFILLYQPVFFLLYLNLLMRVLEVASSNNEGFNRIREPNIII